MKKDMTHPTHDSNPPPVLRKAPLPKISRPKSTENKFNYTVDVLVIVDYSIYNKLVSNSH